MTKQVPREPTSAARELIEANADGLLVLRPDGRVCFANPAAARLLGRERESLLGSHFGTPVVPGETAEIDLPNADPTRVCIAELQTRFIEWEGGPAVVASLRDITERKQMESALRFRAEASRKLAQSLDESTVLKAIADLALGHLGESCFVHRRTESACLQLDLCADRNSNLTKRRQQRVVAAGRDFSIDDRRLRVCIGADLRDMWREIGVRAIVTAPLRVQGRLIGMFSVLRFEETGVPTAAECELIEDFALRSAAALENARLFAEVQDENRRKAEFLAMLGHELRNPLAAIRSACGVLTADLPTSHAASVIERQVRHMTRLVDDLVEMARVTRGVIRLNRQRIDLRTILHNSTTTCRSFIIERRHTLLLDFPTTPVTVLGDETRLEQIACNLLDNAAKYTDPGGTIRVSLRIVEGWAEFTVQDSGIGIAPDLLPRIFRLFNAGPQALDRSRGGLGIGLTLVQRLVEMHGGTVSASSDGPGCGSLFVVRLPCVPAESMNEAVASRVVEAKPARVGRRVLLVEDNADSREMLGRLLTIWGFAVSFAGDGPSALRLIAQDRPEVCLIDIGLPGMDGYELARRIRAGRDPAEVPRLYALTGYGTAEDLESAVAAGFDRHLVKPIDPTLLQSLLSR